jgi:hypothetical protein
MLSKEEILSSAPKDATHYAVDEVVCYYKGIKPRSYSYMNIGETVWNHIAGVTELTPVPLADLRKKQGKTVVDAVNYFKGEIPQLYTDEYVNARNNYYIVQNDCVLEVDDVESNLIVCDKYEFNQCVKYMSEHNGLFEAYVRTAKQPLTKENSDYSFYEPTKPLYTQAMKDAGELPSVGMEVVVEGYKYKANEESKVKAVVLGIYKTTKSVVKTKLICQSMSESVGVELFDEWWPIDTRTPEQKQVDDIMTALHEMSCAGVSYEYQAKTLQSNGHLKDPS